MEGFSFSSKHIWLRLKGFCVCKSHIKSWIDFMQSFCIRRRNPPLDLHFLQNITKYSWFEMTTCRTNPDSHAVDVESIVFFLVHFVIYIYFDLFWFFFIFILIVFSWNLLECLEYFLNTLVFHGHFPTLNQANFATVPLRLLDINDIMSLIRPVQIAE